MKRKFKYWAVWISALTPLYSYADVSTMMTNLQSAILNVVAPMSCICGVIFSGIKLAMGDESAKKTLLWSCFGTVVTFSAPSLLSFLQTRVAS